MRRLITFVIIAGFIGFGTWWLWNNNDRVQNIIGDYVDNGEILTLEARFTPSKSSKPTIKSFWRTMSILSRTLL